MSDSTSDLIRLTTTDGVGLLTLNRPDKRNAMSFAMLGDFIATVKAAGDDDAIKVLIITGSGGSFCAGTDLSDLASVPGADRGLRGSAEDRDRWWPIVECPKPVIAAVDGPAVGMGAEFTSQCDIRIASTNARFAWNFVHRGLVPDTGAGSWLLPRLVGPQAAMRLLYTGAFLGAEEAATLGYVDAVVEPEALLEHATTLAQQIAAGSPFSLRRIKAMIYEGLGSEVGPHMERHTQYLAECFKSEDHQEGVQSFLERRPAVFNGR